MPTVGATGKPTAFQEWFGLNADNHFGEVLTMPEDGTIHTVGVWAAGKDAAVSARCVVWGTGGNLVAYSGLFTMAGRPFGLGQADLYEASVAVVANAGTPLYIGFARNPNGAIQLPYDGGGSHRHLASGSWPVGIEGGSDHGGNMGAYFIYTADEEPPPPTGSGVRVRRGGAWVEVPVYVRRSGVWVPGDAHVRRGGGWTP